MKITRIETFKYWIDWCNWLLVKVSTDEGLYGWGEGSLHGAIQAVETAIHELGEVLIGCDPSGVRRHWQELYHAWRWRGGPVLSTALGALDIALWDLEGKRLGVPVYRLLGGPYRTRIRVYASHWLSGITSPEQAYEGAKEAVRRGFTAFKWSPHFRNPESLSSESAFLSHVHDLMTAARDGAGPEVDIYIDWAERLSPRTAMLAARRLAPTRPGWFEEPIPFENAKAMVMLRNSLSVPIATGERLLSRWDVRELLESRGCDIIMPDVMHCCGITEAFNIATMADTYYIPVSPHNPGGPICTLASMHLVAAIPNFLILEQMEDERQLRDEVCTNTIAFRDGCFELPEGPGLGTDLNLDVLQERSFKRQPTARSSECSWR